MTYKNEFVCIACPVGCALTATKKDNDINVTGNKCKVGIQYAIKEMTAPSRTLTTSVKVYGQNGYKMLSVKTASEIPKDKLLPVLAQIKALELQGDWNIGDVLIKNVLETGVDVVATRAIRCSNEKQKL